MADVNAFDRYNQKITLPESDVPALVKSGGRLPTEQEIAEHRLEAKYEATPAAVKIGGALTGAVLPPTLEAWQHGGIGGLTAGLGQAAVYKSLQEIDPKAASAYRENEELLKTAKPGTYAAGEVGGVLGGSLIGGAAVKAGGAALGLSRVLPSALIGEAGTLAEQGVGRALAGTAARGVAGRAVSTGVGLAAQGATENLLYGVAKHAGEEILADRDLAAEKIFATAGTDALYGGLGGFGLGAAGSLVKSGAGALTRGASRSLSSVVGKGKAALSGAVGKGESAIAGVARKADEVAGELGALGDRAAAATGTKPAQEVGAFRKFLTGTTDDDVRGLAHDQAWRSLNAEKRFAKEADKYLSGGTSDVGEVLLRRKIIDSDEGLVRAATHGTPAEMLPKIQANREAVGKALGSITEASPARAGAADIDGAFRGVINRFGKAFGSENKAAAAAVREDLADLYTTLNLSAPGQPLLKGQKMSASIGDLVELRKEYDKIIYAKPMASRLDLEARREARSGLEDLIVRKIDEAAGAGGKVAEELKSLKKDYQALRIAEDAAEDAASRGARNQMLGLGEKFAAAAALGTGNFAAAPVIAVGGSLLRQRGNAAAAVLLHRMADMGTITKALRSFDDQIARSAKGVLAPPAKGSAAGTSSEPIRIRANRVLSSVRQAQSDPESTIKNIEQHADVIRRVAPETAAAYAKTATRALAYIASQVPDAVANDPLSPKTSPLLTDRDASRIARLGEYVNDPMKFFRDAERGVITPEGVEMARFVLPKAFAELQVKTLEEIATHKKRFDLSERMRLSMLLDIPGDASVRPNMISLLQDNVTSPPPEEAPKRAGGPINLNTKPNALDRLEEN